MPARAGTSRLSSRYRSAALFIETRSPLRHNRVILASFGMASSMKATISGLAFVLSSVSPSSFAHPNRPAVSTTTTATVTSIHCLSAPSMVPSISIPVPHSYTPRRPESIPPPLPILPLLSSLQAAVVPLQTAGGWRIVVLFLCALEATIHEPSGVRSYRPSRRQAARAIRLASRHTQAEESRQPQFDRRLQRRLRLVGRLDDRGRTFRPSHRRGAAAIQGSTRDAGRVAGDAKGAASVLPAAPRVRLRRRARIADRGALAGVAYLRSSRNLARAERSVSA